MRGSGRAVLVKGGSHKDCTPTNHKHAIPSKVLQKSLSQDRVTMLQWENFMSWLQKLIFTFRVEGEF